MGHCLPLIRLLTASAHNPCSGLARAAVVRTLASGRSTHADNARRRVGLRRGLPLGRLLLPRHLAERARLLCQSGAPWVKTRERSRTQDVRVSSSITAQGAHRGSNSQSSNSRCPARPCFALRSRRGRRRWARRSPHRRIGRSTRLAAWGCLGALGAPTCSAVARGPARPRSSAGGSSRCAPSSRASPGGSQRASRGAGSPLGDGTETGAPPSLPST